MGLFGKAKPKPARTTRPQVFSADESYRIGYAKGRSNLIESGYTDTFFYKEYRGGYGPSADIPHGTVVILTRPAVNHQGAPYDELQISINGKTSTSWPLPANVDAKAYANGVKVGISEYMSEQFKLRQANEEIVRRRAEAANRPWREL